jgi:MFS family permease
MAITIAAMSYAMMTFLMTATPISMHVIDHLTVSQTGMVIQWHVVGMFLPSLITGHLIQRFGCRRIALLGMVSMGLCVGISQLNQTLASYWSSLVCLGIG